MNNTSQTIETKIAAWAVLAKTLSDKTNDVISEYNATDAATLVTALASNSTPATVSTQLTKSQVTNMIGALLQVQKFFGNQAVTQGDYLNNLQNVLHGSAVLATKLSSNVEDVGETIKSLASQMNSLHLDAKDIVSLYNTSELGTAVNVLSSFTIVFGSSTTKTKMAAGIVLLDQFTKMIGNLVVTTGDYLATTLSWT